MCEEKGQGPVIECRREDGLAGSLESLDIPPTIGYHDVVQREKTPVQTLSTKRSKQRERILQVLKQTRSHPTAEWVFEQVRAQMPKISLGTVYRNLHILTQQGKIQELDFGEGTRRYDACIDEHYHFVCERCGTVKDLDIEPLPEINTRFGVSVPGQIKSHRLDFFGICSDCLQSS